MYKKLPKLQLMRMKKRKLERLERSLVEKGQQKLNASPNGTGHLTLKEMVSRKMQDKRKRERSLKEKSGFEEISKEDGEVPKKRDKVMNMFVLRNQGLLSISSNLEKIRDASRKRRQQRKKFGFDRRIKSRYLEAKVDQTEGRRKGFLI